MTRDEILRRLCETDETRLGELWERADRVRRERVGEAVHLRGLIEISNHCARNCHYCGLRRDNTGLERYRMTRDEILASAREGAGFGYGTVVLQAGEDYGLAAEWIAEIVREIKETTLLAVTLSLGERSAEETRLWKQAGADRYLLRFETSDPALYRRIHPDRAGILSDRVAMLRRLREEGYEIGSGVMIGIPGQSFETLAGDLLLFRELDLDMIGVGPFIAHPRTPLGGGTGGGTGGADAIPPHGQAPNTELMAYKVIALTRILCPEANIPSTTAIATLNKATGRELGLQRGANVVMPNLTPRQYRALYEIYPAKACIDETSFECRTCMRGRIHSIGRVVGTGPGGRKQTRA